MRGHRRAARGLGFTLIEFVIVTAVTAVLLTVAIGGLGGMFSRKRLEGAAADVATHLQQARSEAVSRNVPVRVMFGTNCHVVHTWPTGATAPTCNGNTVTFAAPVVVITRFDRGVNDVTVTRQPTATPVDYYEFDPRNGVATTNLPAATIGQGVVVGSTAGGWQLRIRVGPAGRVELCTPPTATLAGYAPCPP